MRVLCEGMSNPTGIDKRAPWISWELEEKEKDFVPEKFQVLTESRGEVLWDSGIRNGFFHQMQIPDICGEHQDYRAVVRLWDQEGNMVEQNGQWSTGFLNPDSWLAGFITGGDLLRREFTVSAGLKRAVIYYTGLGYCEAFVNGEKISDRVLFPSYTVYEKTVEYTTQDITEKLIQGRNAVGIALAGHWPLDDELRAKDVYSEAFYRGRLAAICQIVLLYEDGRREDICTDLQWKCSRGPVLCSSVFDGETYDARLEQRGWSAPGFDDHTWKQAVWCRESLGMLRYSYTVPIRVISDIQPVKIWRKGKAFLVDFGQNFTGWMRIKSKEKEGTPVRIRYGELLYEDGSLNVENMRAAKVTDTMICSGREEWWEPSFTYHGFRYAEITGVSQLKPEEVTGREVHSDNEETAEFECSNPLFQQIYKNMMWTIRGNLFSVPTDCCQRDERQGWMADAGVSSEFAVLNFDLQRFYRKWFQDIRDTQEEDGSLPYAGAPGWKRETFTWKIGYHLCLRYLYQYTGDLQAVRENYQALKAYEEYMQSTLVNGLIPEDFYNDWLAIEFADKLMIANAFFVDFYNSMVLFAEVMEDAVYLATLKERKENLIRAVNDKFYGECLDNQLGTGYYGTCDTLAVAPSAMAIAYGIVPGEWRQKVIRELLFQLTQSRGSVQFPTGILTSKTLTDCLSMIGRDDITWEFMNRREYPSFGFMIEKGATTIWERWQYLVHNEMNSHNHPALCGMGAWFFKALCGLKNFSCDSQGRPSAEICPYIPDGMTYARMKIKTPWGIIALGWHKEDGKIIPEEDLPAAIEVKRTAV